VSFSAALMMAFLCKTSLPQSLKDTKWKESLYVLVSCDLAASFFDAVFIH